MMIAVVSMRMVQVAVDQVIHMIPVRYGLMAAAGAVAVSPVVSPTVVVRGALRGVTSVYGQNVLVYVISVNVMQVAVVQVILMAVVLNCGVTTTRSVLVAMLTMLPTLAHGVLLGLSARLLPFSGMCEYSVDQLDDMLVGQRLEDVFSFTARHYQVLGTEDP